MKYFFAILFIFTIYTTSLAVDSSSSAENMDIKLIYFYKPGCIKCIIIKKQLKILAKSYAFLNIKEYNIKETESLELAVSLIDELSIPEKDYFRTPMIILGDNYYTYNNFSINKIRNDIVNLQKSFNKKQVHINSNLIPCMVESLTLTDKGYNRSKLGLNILSKQDKNSSVRNNSVIVNKFNSFSVITIILAGLIDGVNPCAFAILIFFLSYLKIARRTIKQLITVGVVYTSVVFLTYLLIGLGFFHTLKSVAEEYQFIAYAVYFASGLIALIFAVLSFWDIWMISQGHFNKVKIQLSTRTKKKVHKLIRNQSRGVYVIIGVIVVAIGVSFLELGCTGQIYLPVLSYILQQNIINYKAVILLLLYNFAFIFPLIIIFIMFILGLSHERFLKFFQNNLIKIKLITGLLFLCLGIIILVQLFW